MVIGENIQLFQVQLAFWAPVLYSIGRNSDCPIRQTSNYSAAIIRSRFTTAVSRACSGLKKFIRQVYWKLIRKWWHHNTNRRKNILQNSETFKLPIRFVWGVQPVDDGNYLIPTQRGSLHFDNTFNVSSVEAQKWLLDFCKDFKQQSFYQFSQGPPMVPNCFIETFIRTMQRR